jgi:hypothetical protein
MFTQAVRRAPDVGCCGGKQSRVVWADASLAKIIKARR